MDWKLELVTVPVADVDRAIAFYTDRWVSSWITTTRWTRGSGSSN